RQVEECHLGRVWRADGYQVSIPDLLQAERLGQVLHGAARDIVVVGEEFGSLFGQAPRIERGLQRPGRVIDEALLVSADDPGALPDSQPGGQLGISLLHLELDIAEGW